MVKAIARAVVEGEGSRGAQSSGDSWTRSSAAMQEGWLDELAAVGGALDSLQVCMSDVSEKVVADFTLQYSEIFKSEVVLPVLQDRQFSSKGGNVSLMHEGEFDACSCEKIRRKNDLHVDGPVVHDMTVLDLAEDLNNDDERERIICQTTFFGNWMIHPILDLEFESFLLQVPLSNTCTLVAHTFQCYL